MTCRARVLDNADYATDFNFIFDPEAAHIVLNAPWQNHLGRQCDDFRPHEPALADDIGASTTAGALCHHLCPLISPCGMK
jgi:hypothetical protein